jgi:hypothetical protein
MSQEEKSDDFRVLRAQIASACTTQLAVDMSDPAVLSRMESFPKGLDLVALAYEQDTPSHLMNVVGSDLERLKQSQALFDFLGEMKACKTPESLESFATSSESYKALAHFYTPDGLEIAGTAAVMALRQLDSNKETTGADAARIAKAICGAIRPGTEGTAFPESLNFLPPAIRLQAIASKEGRDILKDDIKISARDIDYILTGLVRPSLKSHNGNIKLAAQDMEDVAVAYGFKPKAGMIEEELKRIVTLDKTIDQMLDPLTKLEPHLQRQYVADLVTALGDGNDPNFNAPGGSSPAKDTIDNHLHELPWALAFLSHSNGDFTSFWNSTLANMAIAIHPACTDSERVVAERRVHASKAILGTISGVVPKIEDAEAFSMSIQSQVALDGRGDAAHLDALRDFTRHPLGAPGDIRAIYPWAKSTMEQALREFVQDHNLPAFRSILTLDAMQRAVFELGKSKRTGDTPTVAAAKRELGDFFVDGGIVEVKTPEKWTKSRLAEIISKNEGLSECPAVAVLDIGKNSLMIPVSSEEEIEIVVNTVKTVPCKVTIADLDLGDWQGENSVSLADLLRSKLMESGQPPFAYITVPPDLLASIKEA